MPIILTYVKNQKAKQNFICFVHFEIPKRIFFNIGILQFIPIPNSINLCMYNGKKA